ncbi:MAG: hypothetical protein A3J74_07910 [Elusimicrobia bacterium RIFCSPHIGHO2_02_FULL_57_9]|nr:MAG: hypothetical protein A3J74_07910 [Elusimicrobia bacterium RIFCSPHIGHO2_02_FULL_57_9]
MRFFKTAALLVFLAGASGAENLKISVYHTNDIHGGIMSRPAAHDEEPKRKIGGAAAMASLIKQDKNPKLILDAGDWFQGTPEGNLSRGQSLIDVFNAVGYDAVAVGNHDFDFGEARLKTLVKGLKMPALGANIYRVKGGKRVDYLRPWIIKEVAGIKIGIFGLLTAKMPSLAFPDNYTGLKFRRELDEAKDVVKALREQGAHVIIALTHVGFESQGLAPFEGDQTLAGEVKGIDLIVGGHTHTPVKDPLRDANYGTLIVQAGTALSSVGRVVLEIDRREKRVIWSSGELVDLWVKKVGEDPEVLAVVQRHERGVGRLYDAVIATAAVALRRSRDNESALGSWMTDCARQWAGTDIAVQNGGGIRADMDGGPLTPREIFNIMPFDNRVVKLTMKGRLIRDAINHGTGKGLQMLQVSGISFFYNRDKAQTSSVFVGSKPLDDEASYTVATLDFLVEGGDGYSPFSRAEKKDFTGTLMRDVLRECAEKQALIKPPASGRMRPGARGG